MLANPSSGNADSDRRPDADPATASFQLLEHLPFGVALFRVVRAHGALVDFVSVRKNREFSAIVGLDDLPGRGHFERFPDARSTLAARRFLETIERVLATGQPETVETYAPSPARSYQFEVADAGIADHILIVVRRIDSVACARQIEQLFKEQEFLFEGQSIGYWKSVNRVFSWTNAVFDQMLGYQRHELLGKSSRLVYPSAERFDAIGRRLADPEQARTGIHFDAQFVRKDGRSGWFEVVLQQIADDDGEMTLIGSCIDRSSEHASVLALRKSEQRLMTCLKGSGSAYFDWDITSGEVEFDRGLRSILGTIPGNSFAALLAMTHRADREIVQRYLDGHMDSDIVSHGCEFRVRHSDGHWIWVLLRGSVVEFNEINEPDESDARNGRTPARMAGTLTDVTAAKRIERETGQLLHRLEHLIKERISVHDRPAGSPSAAARVATLSRRQTEVLRLIAAGNTSTEIAKSLHISEATVHSHRKEIMHKLGQKNVATLTRFAIEAGLL